MPVAASCVRGGDKAAVCAPPPCRHYYYGDHCLGSVQRGETHMLSAERGVMMYKYTLLFLAVLLFIAAMPNVKAHLPAVACQSNVLSIFFFFLGPPAVLHPDT